MVHKNPAQVRRLIERLNCADAGFVLHVDGNQDIAPFQKELAQLPKDVRLAWNPNRIKAGWGSFASCQTDLSNLRYALAVAPDSDYIIRLSGQDYPLWPADRIPAFFRQFEGNPSIQCVPFGRADQWPGWVGWRTDRYYYSLPFGRGRRVYPPDHKLKGWKEKVWNGLMRIRFPMPKRLPEGLVPHGGCAWWALTPDSIRAILADAKRRPDVRKYFETAHVPDEMYIHTLIATNPDFAGRIRYKPLHFEYWSTTSHPDILSMVNSEAIKQAATTCPLARKFDMARHPDILDWIDQVILA